MTQNKKTYSLSDHHFKKQVFEVPDSYFEKLIEETVSRTDNPIRTKIVSNTMGSSVFHTPDNYFNELTKAIQEQTIEKKKNAKIIKWRLLAPTLAAACLLLFFVLTDLELPISGQQDLLAEVTTTDLIAYLEENDLAEEDLYEQAIQANISFDDIDYLGDTPLINIDIDELDDSFIDDFENTELDDFDFILNE